MINKDSILALSGILISTSIASVMLTKTLNKIREVDIKNNVVYETHVKIIDVTDRFLIYSAISGTIGITLLVIALKQKN